MTTLLIDGVLTEADIVVTTVVVPPPPPSGASITTSGGVAVSNITGYTVANFTSNGTLTISNAPTTGVVFDFLNVGGGGPGGFDAGGGGSAGEVSQGQITLQNGTYSVTIGQGGISSIDASSYGTSGGDTTLVDSGNIVLLYASGGLSGGTGNISPDLRSGLSGINASGARSNSNKTSALGTPPRGNNGGSTTDTSGAGSGGSSFEAGKPGQANYVGAQRAHGVVSSITGSSIEYGTSGPGASNCQTPPDNSGVGSLAGYIGFDAVIGRANMGDGGGGGKGGGRGANGTAGRFIIRWAA